MIGLKFYSPYCLLLIPLAVAAVWWAQSLRSRPAAMFSSVSGLKELPVTLAQRVRRLLPYAYGLGLVLLIVALARPRQGKTESRRSTEGIAIELAIDVSGSMEALDFKLKGEPASRVNAVKHVITEFVGGSEDGKLAGRPSDLVGLVSFGGFADNKCPLTLDHGALLDMVKSLEVPEPVYDRQGRVLNAEELATAIGDGVSTAIDRLKSVEAKSKILILLTDGDNNAGIVDPREAARIAQTFGIKIYTIGIGTNGPVPFPVKDPFGNKSIQWQQFPIDEELLRDIAKTAGGRYFHASDITALTQVYAEIDKLEKTKVESLIYTEYLELFQWPALAGLALLLGTACLNLTRFRAMP